MSVGNRNSPGDLKRGGMIEKTAIAASFLNGRMLCHPQASVTQHCGANVFGVLIQTKGGASSPNYFNTLLADLTSS
jgi:hypothetical protein